jgi:heme exporter protein A
MQAHLAARDIACRRGDRLLFRGFSANLSAGEALHITGPNGCGKSSLLRILAGLLRSAAGSVERSERIGLIDERTALAENRTVAEALGFWTRIDGGQPPDAATWMDALRLSHLAHIPVQYLSTGQRKRAAMCRLLGQNAPLWLLDEPLNGLDEDGVTAFERLIADHLAGGGVCVITSHRTLDLLGLQHSDLTQFAA